MTQIYNKLHHCRNDLLCVEWHVKPYTLTHTDITARSAVFSN